MTAQGRWAWTSVAGAIGAAVVAVVTFGGSPGAEGLRPGRLVRGAVASVVHLTGTLQPRRRHNVAFGSNGRVETVLATVGATVRKGSVLARLESSQARFLVRRRELELRRARARLSSPSEADDAIRQELAPLDVEQAELELDFANQQLSNLEARSPVTGVVVFVGVQPGDFASGAVGTGVPSFVIVEDQEYVVEAEGEEAEVRGAKPGSKAVVTFAAPDSTILDGNVEGTPVLRRLAANGAPSQWGLRVLLAGHPEDTSIGRTARVEIRAKHIDNVILAPLQALFRFNGADHVLMRDRAGAWIPTLVKVGISDESVAELVLGPPEGTVVLTGSSDLLRQYAGLTAAR